MNPREPRWAWVGNSVQSRHDVVKRLPSRFEVMAAPVTILVDSGERRSPVPAALAALGARVETASLGVADYLIADGWAVERKTSRDLSRSIISGRLWSQVSRLRTLRRPYLVIEGSPFVAPGVARAGVQGAVLQLLDNGIAVLWSHDAEDTARWLIVMAKRASRVDPEVGARRRRGTRVTTSVGLLSTVPGVTPATARCLLECFGSIGRVADASIEELMAIPGLGRKRATRLKHALQPTSLP
jgi:DNA excision repair protein ERCC-4